VAHFQATGKRTLLDVALRNASLLARVFGPGARRDVPGHQEVELGLVKLYRVSGEQRYLDLARSFLDQRGNAKGHELYGPYNQDHLPVTEQSEAVGHAVRAGYMYAAMADVAALTGDSAYAKALDRLWRNVVSRKLYVTGGIGARDEGEAFGDEYELPNRTAYAETCAAIANAMWNHRLFLLHGEASYLDVMERVLYNGFLAGVSLGGDRFFYCNPLASDGEYKFNQGAAGRQPWFDCSCCPTNVSRFMPSIAGYVYAQRGREVYVNLFVSSEATLDLGGLQAVVRQETRYPWAGTVRFELETERPEEVALNLRVPGWATGPPLRGGLYRYLSEEAEGVRLRLNGEVLAPQMASGFARVKRVWKKGDTLELTIPLAARRVVADERVKADVGRVALVRGPLVYCAEAADNDGQVHNIVLPDDGPLRVERRADLLGGVTIIRSPAAGLFPGEDGRSVATRGLEMVAVPYYAWGHRGEGAMAVWLPRHVILDLRVP
jgi:DUF1680 family protein